MFGIGFTEFILIAVVVLLVFGPERIPGVARTAARLYREVRTTGREFTGILKSEMGEFDKDIKDLNKEVRNYTAEAGQKPQPPSVYGGGEKGAQQGSTPADWLKPSTRSFSGASDSEHKNAPESHG